MQLRPNRPIWPDRLFWEWSFRSLCKGAYFGLVIGGLWTLIGLASTKDGDIASRIVFTMSFMIDAIFVFVISATSMMIGLMHNSWDNIAIIMYKGRSVLLRRLLTVMVVPMAMAVIIRYYMYDAGLNDSAFAVASFNFVFSTGVAAATAYTVYVTKAVMTKQELEEEAQLEAEQRERGIIRRTLSKAWHFGKGRQKIGLFILPIMIIPVSSLALAYWAADSIATPKLISLFYGVFAGILIVLLGVIMRLLDTIKIYGDQESLVPAYELHMAQGPRADLYEQ